MTGPRSNPFELRFFHHDQQVLSLTERNIDSPHISESAAEIPMFEARLHSDQLGLLRPVRNGQVVEAWAQLPGKDAMTRVVRARIDHLQYDSDAARESMRIQARSRAGVVVDRGCDASLTGTLAEVIARIAGSDECVLDRIDRDRRISAYVRVGSSYAALRAIGVSLGAAVVHRTAGTLAVVPTAPLAGVLGRAPSAHIGDNDVLGMHYELGRSIKKR